MSVVTELVALLRLQTDRSSFQQGQNSIESLIKPLEAALGADLLGRLATGFGNVAKQAADLADVSAELGITTDRLQALQYAGELGGMSAEAMTGALGRLASMAGAANSGLGEQAELFKRLGVNTKGSNGEILGTADLLPQIADGIQNLSSHTQRAAAVQQLFGRGARALIPVLAQGRDGLAALDAEFKALGGGFSKEQIEAADKYDDQLVKLSVSAKSFGGAMIEQVLPGVQRVSETFTKFVGNTNSAISGTSELGAALAITAALAVAQGAAMIWAGGRTASILKMTALVGGLAVAWGEVRSAILGGRTELGKFLDQAAGVGTLDKTVRNLAAGFEVYRDILAGKNSGIGDPTTTIGGKELGIVGARNKYRANRGRLELESNPEVRDALLAEQTQLAAFLGLSGQTKARALAAAGIGRANERGLGGALENVVAGTAAPSAVNMALQSIPGLPADVHATTNKDGLTVVVPNVNVTVANPPGADARETAKQTKAAVNEAMQETLNQARRSRASRVAKDQTP